MNVYVDLCYHLKPDLAIVTEPVLVVAPDMEMLVMMRNSDFAMAMALENVELGLPVVMAPVMRVKEKHGNAQRNRKRKGHSEMCISLCNVLYMNHFLLMYLCEDKQHSPHEWPGNNMNWVKKQPKNM